MASETSPDPSGISEHSILSTVGVEVKPISDDIRLPKPHIPCEVESPNSSKLVLYSAICEKSIQATRYCPAQPYVKLQVPEAAKNGGVHRITFTTESHDQGFSGNPQDAGTYSGSYTWFEAGVSTAPGRDSIPRRFLQSNVTASHQYKTHVVTWDVCTADDATKQWMKRIRGGDYIQIIQRAQYQAWVNYIKSARLDIQVELNPEARATLDTADSRTVPNDYGFFKPLDTARAEIRLLVLEPGSPEDPISCHFIPSSLKDSNTPDFEALSYCWGDMMCTKTITLRLSDSDERQTFQVTLNLHDALQHLRYTDNRSRTLWVDALCINQSDLTERADQVGIMGDIYSLATSVCIWLGSSTVDSQNSMSLIKDTVSLNDGKSFGPKFLNGDYWYMLETISQMLNAPWFYRVWVVQEVWKSKKAIVYYGGMSMPWEWVVWADEWHKKPFGGVPGGGFPTVRQYDLPSIWTQLAKPTKDTATAENSYDILDLILESTSLKATDPRDKIYALLGLSKQIRSLHPAIRPDYTKSASLAFTEFTRWWITEYKSLAVLSFIHGCPTRTWQGESWYVNSNSQPEPIPSDYPSWAIWHDSDGKWAKRTLGLNGGYKASGDTICELDSTTTASSQLPLIGLKLGIIQSVQAFPFFHIQDDGLRKAYIRLFDPASANGTWNFGSTTDNKEETQEVMSLYLDHYVSHWGQWPNPRDARFSLDGGGMDAWDQLAFPCHARCFFKTSKGDIGLCPPMAREGDAVAVLFGGSVPYVLREKTQVDGGQILYEFIGECYVKDKMDGVVVKEYRESGQSAEVFTLV